jgi:hypothetical protein
MASTANQPVAANDSPGSASETYALATGEAAAYRLRVLHSLYGSGARRVLLESGFQCGMRVADLGFGVGIVTALLAAGFPAPEITVT